jgi:hypothetical protein
VTSASVAVLGSRWLARANEVDESLFESTTQLRVSKLDVVFEG